MELQEQLQNGEHETFELVEGIEVKLALKKQE
jgi:hypothetical protein